MDRHKCIWLFVKSNNRLVQKRSTFLPQAKSIKIKILKSYIKQSSSSFLLVKDTHRDTETETERQRERVSFPLRFSFLSFVSSRTSSLFVDVRAVSTKPPLLLDARDFTPRFHAQLSCAKGPLGSQGEGTRYISGWNFFTKCNTGFSCRALDLTKCSCVLVLVRNSADTTGGMTSAKYSACVFVSV